MTCQALAYLLTHLVLSNPKNAYTGVSNLLAPLRHTGRKGVVLGHTLNTL